MESARHEKAYPPAPGVKGIPAGNMHCSFHHSHPGSPALEKQIFRQEHVALLVQGIGRNAGACFSFTSFCNQQKAYIFVRLECNCRCRDCPSSRPWVQLPSVTTGRCCSQTSSIRGGTWSLKSPTIAASISRLAHQHTSPVICQAIC